MAVFLGTLGLNLFGGALAINRKSLLKIRREAVPFWTTR